MSKIQIMTDSASDISGADEQKYSVQTIDLSFVSAIANGRLGL